MDFRKGFQWLSSSSLLFLLLLLMKMKQPCLHAWKFLRQMIHFSKSKNRALGHVNSMLLLGTLSHFFSLSLWSENLENNFHSFCSFFFYVHPCIYVKYLFCSQHFQYKDLTSFCGQECLVLLPAPFPFPC